MIISPSFLLREGPFVSPSGIGGGFAETWGNPIVNTSNPPSKWSNYGTITYNLRSRVPYIEFYSSAGGLFRNDFPAPSQFSLTAIFYPTGRARYDIHLIQPAIPLFGYLGEILTVDSTISLWKVNNGTYSLLAIASIPALSNTIGSPAIFVRFTREKTKYTYEYFGQKTISSSYVKVTATDATFSTGLYPAINDIENNSNAPVRAGRMDCRI